MAAIEVQDAACSFAGLRVLTLESRRGPEMARLIESYGGRAVLAPAMREVPREANPAATEFAHALIAGGFDIAVFLTGVGTRALARAAEGVCSREQFAAALRRITVVARGPKSVAALRELDVPVTVAAPQPNTWRELLAALDERKATLPLAGRRVAVQEYGVANPELLAELEARGAIVTRVPVYNWALPDDTAPLRTAIRGLAAEEFDVALFTTAIQVNHLLLVAGEMGLAEAVRSAMRHMVVGSIGPATTEGLVALGLAADLEATQPRMGILVREAAQRSTALLRTKRRAAVSTPASPR
jgi:uroporphyrinogen-III synthase